MENIAKKILSDIAEQLKPLIENKLHGPFFFKRKNKWRFVIEPTKPSFESLRFDLFQSQNGENSDLTLAVQSIENHELVFKIFK